MSTFPTKILLAIDGSEDALLAATTAVDVANSTDSELHVVHARFGLPWTTGYYSATEPPTTSIQRIAMTLDHSALWSMYASLEELRGKIGHVLKCAIQMSKVAWSNVIAKRCR